MHNIKSTSIINITLLIQLCVIVLTMTNVERQYYSKQYISEQNKGKGNVEIVPDNLVKLSIHDSIWSTHNNPVTKVIQHDCYVDKRLASKLSNMKNIRILSCWLSKSKQNYIMNHVSHGHSMLEYRNIELLREYLKIDRSSGLVVDIELLDDNGNKLNRKIKHLNFNNSISNDINISKLGQLGLTKVSKNPWTWKG